MFHISVLCNNHKVKLRIKMIRWCFEFKWHTVQVYFIQFCANTNKYDDDDDKSMLNVEIAKKFVPETLSLSLKIYTIDTCVCVCLIIIKMVIKLCMNARLFRVKALFFSNNLYTQIFTLHFYFLFLYFHLLFLLFIFFLLLLCDCCC